MSRVSVYSVTVEWGDCDPAQIVFYPNYFRWFDAATRTLIEAAGWPYARLTERFGVIGLPLSDASVRFLRPTRYREHIEFRSRVESWQERRFTVLHQGYRDDILLVEGREIRICGQVHPEDPHRLVAVPIPAEFKEALDR